jgi:hypothetical protein
MDYLNKTKQEMEIQMSHREENSTFDKREIMGALSPETEADSTNEKRKRKSSNLIQQLRMRKVSSTNAELSHHHHGTHVTRSYRIITGGDDS